MNNPYVPADWRTKIKQASLLNYEDKKHTQNRPGWKWGKCPVSEYYGKINEAGLALAIHFPLEDICWFSTDKNDYTKADAGSVEFKTGYRFNMKDIEVKGAQYILWGRPVETGKAWDCGYDTCGSRSHHTLTGEVHVRGYTDVKDLGRYKRSGTMFRMPHEGVLLPFNTLDLGVAV